MSQERRGHPGNWLHRELFAIDANLPDDAWWSEIGNMIGVINELDDERSVASVMTSVFVVIKSRSEKLPYDEGEIDDYVDQHVIPLWEREISKTDEWRHIPDRVNEYAGLVGGVRGRELVAWGAETMLMNVPSPEEVMLDFPDDSVSDGIDAVSRGVKGWYQRMMILYKFCEIPDVVLRIQKLCVENEWGEEGVEWARVNEYFAELLLSIDYTKTDPRLVESLWESLQKTQMNSEVRSEIESRVDAWKFVRNHVYRDEEQVGWRDALM